jgi:hypothetical protein
MGEFGGPHSSGLVASGSKHPSRDGSPGFSIRLALCSDKATLLGPSALGFSMVPYPFRRRTSSNAPTTPISWRGGACVRSGCAPARLLFTSSPRWALPPLPWDNGSSWQPFSLQRTEVVPWGLYTELRSPSWYRKILRLMHSPSRVPFWFVAPPSHMFSSGQDPIFIGHWGFIAAECVGFSIRVLCRFGGDAVGLGIQPRLVQGRRQACILCVNFSLHLLCPPSTRAGKRSVLVRILGERVRSLGILSLALRHTLLGLGRLSHQRRLGLLLQPLQHW